MKPYNYQVKLHDGIMHVSFEYVQFCSAAHYAMFGQSPWRTLADKAFLGVYRQLRDFLMRDTRSADPVKKDEENSDILALDYLPPGYKRHWSLPTWDREWRMAMNKQQAHLTYERDKAWIHYDTNIGIPKLEQELRQAWRLFFKDIEPRHKPEFNRQIDAYRNNPSFCHVNFV